jgi:hypothetical protein
VVQSKDRPGKTVQAVVPPALADELRARGLDYVQADAPEQEALSWTAASTGGFDELAGLKASFDLDRFREKETEPATK